MLTKDYSFELPAELIAQEPVERRGDERLLHLDRTTGAWEDLHMADLPSLLRPGDVLVINNSRVRKARCYGMTDNDGKVEFLFLEEDGDGVWSAMVTKAKKQKEGRRYRFHDRSDGSLAATARIIGTAEDGTKRVVFDEPIDEDFFSRCGHVPLPPYIKREGGWQDEGRYQTVYATQSGSVAAPTAGLHFTPELLGQVRDRGVEIHEVTLHVGAGTFLPVRSENIEDHHMHFERCTVSQETADAINKAKTEGRRIVAVGTTSVRTLESAADREGHLRAMTMRTDIFIHPPYRFKIVDALLTNFHTPESTLLMLVSALAGREHILAAYKHAVEERYRFFSYGDAMFID